MPAYRTPLNKPYKGHHPRANSINGTPQAAAAIRPRVYELVLVFRSQEELDDMQRWLDQVYDTSREGCICQEADITR